MRAAGTAYHPVHLGNCAAHQICTPTSALTAFWSLTENRPETPRVERDCMALAPRMQSRVALWYSARRSNVPTGIRRRRPFRRVQHNRKDRDEPLFPREMVVLSFRTFPEDQIAVFVSGPQQA